MKPHDQFGAARSRRGRWGVAAGLVFGVLAVVEGGETPDVEKWRRQVEYLTESLVAAKAEADALRARVDREAFEADGNTGASGAWGGADLVGRELSILEVNEELGMAVLSGGRAQGLRPGLQLAAMRGDKVVARLRVVDVRPTIAGAVIQRAGREFPGVKDRVVLATGSKE